MNKFANAGTMVTKSVLLIAVTVLFIIGSSSGESFQFQDSDKSIKENGSLCDFFTFGQAQDDVGNRTGFYCPQYNKNETFCCYGALRQPFCCDSTSYLIVGFMWISVVVLIFSCCCRIMKCGCWLKSGYNRF